MDIEKLKLNKNQRISNDFCFMDIMNWYFEKAEKEGMVYMEE